MAFVICCVDLTALIRRRMSSNDGMVSYAAAVFCAAAKSFPNSSSAAFSSALSWVVDLLLLGERREELRLARVEELVELLFVGANGLDRHRVQITVGGGIDDRHLLLDGERLILRLFQDLDQAAAAIELIERGLVEVGTELRERRELAVLREVEAQRAGHLPHRFHLRRAADARHGVADVDRGSDTLVEEIRLEEDLAVGDRDHVGRECRRRDRPPASR